MTQLSAGKKLEMDVQCVDFTAMCKFENWNAESLFGEDTLSFFLLTAEDFRLRNKISVNTVLGLRAKFSKQPHVVHKLTFPVDIEYLL